MKQIRSLILIAIGIMAFTVTASTTATLEHKQKVEQIKCFDDSEQLTEQVKVVDSFIQSEFKQGLVSSELVKSDGFLKIYSNLDNVGWKVTRYNNLIYIDVLPENTVVSIGPDMTK